MKTAEEIFNNHVNIRTVGAEVAQNIINAMEEYADKWQPVSELPTVSGCYIIYGNYTRDCPKCVSEAYYDHKRRRFNQQGIYSKNVTHWQPLPKPPTQ